jgi:integrase
LGQGQQSALGYWTDYWKEAVVADLTPSRQRAFIKSLKDRGFKNAYVSRILSVGRAALNYCYKEQMIISVPFILDILDRSDEKEAYSLEPSQMRRLLEASRHWPHLHIFCMISLNTMARPDAVFDLSPSQVELEGGFIELNPKGRVQTKKYRPIVPITKTILPYVQSREVVRYVNWHGNAVSSINKSFRTAVELAGLPREITPYSLRHTMATELGRRNVPDMQIDTMLGHAIKGTKRKYIHFKPDYLMKAKQVIEDYVTELGDTAVDIHSTHVPPTCHFNPDNSSADSYLIDIKEKMVGGTSFELVTTTMST